MKKMGGYKTNSEYGRNQRINRHRGRLIYVQSSFRVLAPLFNTVLTSTELHNFYLLCSSQYIHHYESFNKPSCLNCKQKMEMSHSIALLGWSNNTLKFFKFVFFRTLGCTISILLLS